MLDSIHELFFGRKQGLSRREWNHIIIDISKSPFIFFILQTFETYLSELVWKAMHYSFYGKLYKYQNRSKSNIILMLFIK